MCPSEAAIVSEHVNGENLEWYLSNAVWRRELSLRQRLQLILDVAEGLGCLHG